MFKRNLFILICFFIVQPSLWADSKQKISCLDQHQPGRTIYRNDQGDVSCVNYGGKKAVQYIYNKIDRIVLGGMRFSSGAVVGKKFYGFKTVNEGTTYLPNTNEFHSTVLSELFSEINTVQTLDQLIREYYPNEEKRNKLLEEIIKDYESSARTILPEGFYEKSYTEKLGWINDLIANDSSEKKDIQDLSILEKSTLQTHLFKTNGQKISISQCNPTVVNFYNTILTENMVGKRNMKTTDENYSWI